MKRNLRPLRGGAVALVLVLAMMVPTTTLAAENWATDDVIKIAFIDPLSGPFAAVGQAGLAGFRFTAHYINEHGGILGKKVKIIPFDNKGSAQETLQILQEVADSNIHYILQGNGSYVAGALSRAVTKHNQRNPDNQIVYLNYAAVAPELTNEACSFWHFRFDANSRMKLEVLTTFIAKQDDIDKVFLINQDYSHGQYISNTVPKLLAKKAPDIEIVGNILHPVGRVKDFSPYVTQIAASGADAVITGNWGRDLSLLIKAGEQAGLDVVWLTYYAQVVGAPTAIGQAGVGDVYVVSAWNENIAAVQNMDTMQKRIEKFRKTHPFEFSTLQIRTALMMLQKAMEKAGTTKPKAVAYALEGLSYQTPTGKATMRAKDHQLISPQFISVFSKKYAKYDAEGTGLGFRTVMKVPAEQVRLPTSCQMKRPPKS